MTYNNTEVVPTVNVNSKFRNKAISFVDQLSKGLSKAGYHGLIKDVDLTKMANQYNDYKSKKKSYNKAVTGAAANTGSAFVATEYLPFDINYTAELTGRVFRNSGFNFRVANANSIVTPTTGQMGSLVSSTPGTSLPNDITSGNPFENNTIVVDGLVGSIPIYNDPVSQGYIGNLGQLMAVFEELLEIKKDQAEDEKVLSNGTNGITDNPGNLTALATVTGQLPVNRAVKELVAINSKYGVGRPKVYLNQDALAVILNEQDTTGMTGAENYQGIGYGKFRFSTPDGIIPDAGRVGTMAGAEVWVVPTIKNTYTTDASNVITAQTGGTNTMVAVGLPNHGMIARSRPDMDTISTFTPQNSYEAFSTDQSIIAARVGIGGGIINTNTWGYYAFSV